MLEQKAGRLREILAGRARLIVAYPGGVDSAFLAWIAYQALGDRMLAVIADSASLARTHLEEALAFAREQRNSGSRWWRRGNWKIPRTSATMPCAVFTVRTNCSPCSNAIVRARI